MAIAAVRTASAAGPTIETVRNSATFRLGILEARSARVSKLEERVVADRKDAAAVHRPRGETESTRQITIERLQRVEEKTARVSFEVARRQAAPVEGASKSAEARAAGGRTEYGRAGSPLDTVHVAPWLKGASAPAANIEQITEQVIRQIDNRLIAWRERMGKI
jgi:hypothetical protein